VIYKDRPILLAAIDSGVDILVTGDKDFLESGLTTLKIMTAVEFANYPQRPKNHPKIRAFENGHVERGNR
jgi:predicted nucleic acid-binding protein